MVWPAVYVKMEMPVPVKSIKSNILSLTSSEMDKTFRAVVENCCILLQGARAKCPFHVNDVASLNLVPVVRVIARRTWVVLLYMSG